MKIYLCASITHASEQFRKEIEDFRAEIKKKYEVLDFLGLEKGTSSDVYKHDTNCIRNCDLLIADCSYPALGLGFEIATALNLRKRVLAIAKKGSKVSRPILGIDSPFFKFCEYYNINEIFELITLTPDLSPEMGEGSSNLKQTK